MELFLGVLFGAIGAGYLVYAKRQTSAIFLACGVALIIFPYFVSGVLLTFVAGTVIAAFPFLRAR